MKHYKNLEAKFKTMTNLGSALRILAWDQAVMMPMGGIDTRAEQLVTLTTLINQLITAPETQEQLAVVNVKELTEWEQANFRHMQRLQQWIGVIPEKLNQDFTRAAAKSQVIWAKTKEQNDYQGFVPYFQEVLSLTREIATIRAQHFNCSTYEACLENYSPGVKEAELESLFARLQGFLPGFMQEAMNSQRAAPLKISAKCLQLDYEQQKKLGLKIMSVLGFDFNKGRLDTSAHPFCTGIQGDVRITTRYDLNDFTSSLFAIIHETGHALYEQALPQQWLQQPVGEAMSMNVHESQSLIMEMQVGRSHAFMKLLARTLREEIGARAELSSANLFKIANRVQPSFIRVEADEVTYPAHIIIRYNLERAMLDGKLSLQDLPAAWNESYQQLLGITPSNYKEGCMQDIHWPSGAFGYFPSYTIGAIIAAQLFAALKAEIPTINDEIEQGNFQQMKSWLNNKVHKFARRYTTDELLQNITGKKLDLTAYQTYLQHKFLA